MSKFGAKLAGFTLKFFGWDTMQLNNFYKVPKAVVIMAPHTSMNDFTLGRLVAWAYEKPAGFFMKKEALDWPIAGKLLAKMGAIGIDRGNVANHNVELAAERLKNSDELWIVITPEGTRKKVKRWKSGFYRIAQMAEVPILITIMDYKRKIVTIVDEFHPTGDYEADLTVIKKYFEGVTPKHPEFKM